MNSLLLLVVALCAGPVWCQDTLFTPSPVIGQCPPLQGYNLDRLSSVDHWTFNLPKVQQWLLPIDVDVSNVSSVDVSMSLCKPLSSCNSNENATMCQHITLRNGTLIEIDLASFNKSDKFKNLDSSSATTGFALEQTSQIPANYTNCAAGSLLTIIGFECDANAKWSSTDISSFVSADTKIFMCETIIVFKYNGSCYTAPTIAPANCQLDAYNTTTLSRQPYWFANVPHTVCFNGTQDKQCTIIFSFCHAIPRSSIFNLNSCHNDDAAVCQIGVSTDGDTQSEYSMGQYKETTHFEENDNPVNGGFHVELLNGTQISEDCVFKTLIVLGCNKSAKWPESGDLSELIVPIYDEHCQWAFEFLYDGACIPEFPLATDVASPVGWILMGICGLAVIIYLAVGMSVQYFVKGARGSDIIPHFTFWAGVGTLVVEGCKYSLDLVTCFRFKDGFKPIRPNSGVQYDQI